MTSLTSFYLYNAIRFYFEHQCEDAIDQLIEDIPQFCQTIQDTATSTSMDPEVQEAVFTNQIRCLQYLETVDSVCRDELLRVIRFLVSLSPSIHLDLLFKKDTIHTLMQSLLNLLDTEALFL